ncbi:glutamate--tRNA ligase, partial [Candidatus Woesearchaeota archaeon]|nr:glutamate--tRNA ligase [Candidatus Woesearchaeota archaeon]
MEKKLKDAIYKYALHNAIKFEGKANPGALVGRIMGEFPDYRDKTKQVMDIIKAVVNDVNSMSVEEQKAKLKELAPELLEKKKVEKRQLPELEKAEKGKVVTRIPPEPSKYNHFGHAMSFLINYMYAKKYDGKCILRFEDTNPLLAKDEYVEALNDDVIGFLGIEPDRRVYASDDIPRFYELAEQLIKHGKAYVCMCDRETMSENRKKGIACEHSKFDRKTNQKNWDRMLLGEFKEGEAVLRLKADMESPNHVMRDPVIFRLVYAEHYRQGKKYKVWPMYDFENSIEEEFCGITHILRSNEFGKMRQELQEYIRGLFGYKNPVLRDYGRINIVGAVTQGRDIRKLIEEGKMIGWDDPRLVTIRALRRRGIVKETF